jgi:hypothetical protein
MGDWCLVTSISLLLAVPCWIAQSFTSISFLSTANDSNYTLTESYEWNQFQPSIAANAIYLFFRPLSFALSCHSKIMLLNKVFHLFLSNRISKSCVAASISNATAMTFHLRSISPAVGGYHLKVVLGLSHFLNACQLLCRARLSLA